MADELVQGLVHIALGSALGGVARYFVSGLVGRAIGETFPWGTLVVNVSGALTIGLVSALAARQLIDPGYLPLIITGFLGSYTTVSSFSLQTLALVRDGQWLRAVGNVAGSLSLCLAAVGAGYQLAALYLDAGQL